MNDARGRTFIVAVLMALGLVVAAQAGAIDDQPQPLTLTGDSEKPSLIGHVAILRDPSGGLTITQVSGAELAKQFVLLNETTEAPTWSADAYWYRLELHNPSTSTAPTDWVLQIGSPVLDFVDVYLIDQAGSVQASFMMSDNRENAPGQLPHRKYSVPIKVVMGDKRVVYVRVQTAGMYSFNVALLDQPSFILEAFVDWALVAAMLAVLGVMAIYNLLIYAVIRDRIYLYLSFWIMSVMGILMQGTGIGRVLIGEHFPGTISLIAMSAPYWFFLNGLLWLFFSGSFLSFRQRMPRTQRMLVMAVLAGTALLLFNSVLPTGLPLKISLFYSAFVYLFSVMASLYQTRNGYRSPRIYLVVLGIPCLFTATVSLGAIIGVLPIGGALYMAGASGCLCSTLLSLALADRIKIERNETHTAQENSRRLKSFLPQKVADLITLGKGADLLAPKRRQVTICEIDLRDFTPFTAAAEPEEVMMVLQEFYSTMGDIIEQFGGTVEHFAGDSILIFFNAPLEMENPEIQAVSAARAMRSAFKPLSDQWARKGYKLGMGIGIAHGYATIGAIGFSGRSQYAAIGAVTNLAARLCSLAKHDEILTTEHVVTANQCLADAEFMGEKNIKGFDRPVAVMRLIEQPA
jgi:class 3 adenylate cyclase